uniref:F-box only protein 28-like n=1 Tax=Crassostrea virginica TaxID=6565 RepID=A0A8B8DRJ0_CRAVI|nr:F-box only protein 28-like [Crassostrea virginica]
MASNYISTESEEKKMDIEEENDKGVLILTQLPEELIEKILSLLSFNDLAEIRGVCQSFNKCCEQLLNSGFSKIDKLHAQIQKQVKSQLPRRESERRNHPLARHVDILSAIETRLSLLGMTYMRYIDMGLCCFIPGKVLDELLRILNTLKYPQQPPRAHEFLQELRDISSMAMEHFEEKIAPSLKTKMPAVTLPYPFSDCTSREQSPGPSVKVVTLNDAGTFRGHSVKHEISRLSNQVRGLQANFQQQRKELTDSKVRSAEQRKKVLELERKLQIQNKTVLEHEQKIQSQHTMIAEQNQTISDLSKKILEFDQKFADVYSELTRLKGDSDSCLSSQSSNASILATCTSSTIDELGLESKEKRDSLKRRSIRDGNEPSKKQRKI